MGSNIISTIISICLLFGTLGLPASPEAPLVDNSLHAVRTSVFQLAALVRLPFTLTAGMFSEDHSAAPGYDYYAPDRQEENTPPGKTEKQAGDDRGYSLLSQGRDAGCTMKTGSAVPVIGTTAPLSRGAGGGAPDTVFHLLGFQYLLLLICLLALLKGTLPWDRQYAYVKTTRSCVQDRDFLLMGTR